MPAPGPPPLHVRAPGPLCDGCCQCMLYGLLAASKPITCLSAGTAAPCRCHGRETAEENECANCSRGGCTCGIPENCECLADDSVHASVRHLPVGGITPPPS